jgi:hypothetical protein
VRRGPFTLSLARRHRPRRGNGRLVVLSHGSGGNPWVHSDLAHALVAPVSWSPLPEHQRDNARDPPARPGQLEAAPGRGLARHRRRGRDARWRRLLALDRVGVTACRPAATPP